jgi:hypothetical protein
LKLKNTKIWGIAGGAAVVLGAGAAGWVALHPAEEKVVNSDGGLVALDTANTPTPTPDPLQLRVAQANPGSVQGSMQTDGDKSNGPAATATPAPLPGPDEFTQYEKYQAEQTALFGDIIAGTGQEAAAGSTLSVAYRGWLTNGKLFDESYSRGQAFSFTIGEHRVISGWEQGLVGMKVGGKRRLIVPPSAGYGSEAHGVIPANSLLVFDVELLGIK